MKTLLCTLMLATIGTAVAKADSVTITLDTPNQHVLPGETVEIFGTIVNDSNTIVYLNNDDLDLAGLGFTTTDQFFNTVPISLAPDGQPGDSSGNIELFDVTVSNPLVGGPGTFLGTYTLFGGDDGGADTAEDNLGSANFSLAATPEPSSIYLLLSGMAAAWVPVSRRIRTRSL
jgi:hypothetical protein